MSFFGCPSNNDFDWLRGQVLFQSTSQPLIGNLTTDLLHILGPYTPNSLTFNMCLRDDEFVGQTMDWPRGSYCLIKYRDNCPAGNMLQFTKLYKI